MNNWDRSTLRPLFHGICTLEEHAEVLGEPVEGGAWIPLRFGKKRLEEYATHKNIPYGRCATGVRLDFYTDAKEISFDFILTEGHYDGSTQYPADTFDIYENGTLRTSVIADKTSDLRRVSYIPADAGESRITVYFPIRHGIAIHHIRLGHARPVESYRHKILFLGDSITQGLFAERAADGYAYALARDLDADFMNLAVGGEEFRPAALDDEIGFTPDYIIVCQGTNDVHRKHTPEQLKSDAHQYLGRIRQIYGDTPVLVISPFEPYDPAYNEAIREESAVFGMTMLDGTALLPHEKENYSVDLVHPNSVGFGVITRNLLPILKEILCRLENKDENYQRV